jgi:hypothetical protein
MEVNPWHIFTHSPISDPIDGSPLGNGDIGAMFCPVQLRLSFSLCKSNLWDTRFQGTGGGKSFFPARDFTTMQKLVAAGNHDRIYELFRAESRRNKSKWMLIPAGLIQVFPAEREIELAYWRHTLDMQSGIVNLEYKTNYRRCSYETFVSRKYDVLAIKGQCSTKMLPYSVKFKIGPNGGDKNCKISFQTDAASKSIFCRIQGYENLDYYIGLRVIGAGLRATFDKASGSVVLSSRKASNEFAAYVTMASNLDGKRPLEIVKERLATAAKAGFDVVKTDQVRWWRGFWKSGNVSVPDPVIQRQHNLGLYLLASCSRPGCQAPGLQGLWATKPGGSGWNDYTNDFNSQAYFWPAFIGNKLDLLDSYYDTFKKMLPQVCADTRKYYKMRGAAYPLCSSPQGHAAPGYVTHYHWAGLSAFIVENYWYGYLFSRDDEFLRKMAYPVMKQCGLFYLDRISIDKKSGRAVIETSCSPEQGEGSFEAWGTNPNMDIALVKELLGGLVESCEILGCDGDLKRQWQDLLDRMPEYPTANGHMIQIEEHEFKDSHRHGTVLAPIYPCGDMTMLSSRAGRNIAKNTLLNFIARGRSLWEGYTYPWIALTAARLGMADTAHNFLDEFVGMACLHRGGLHLNDDFTGSGKTAGGHKNFTLEGNTMYSAAVMEMLLQSHGGAIEVFGAVPEKWQKVSFDLLRARGAFLISASRRAGETREITIRSLAGGICRILNPFKNGTVKIISKSGTTKFSKRIISFETRPGRSYRIVKG